MTYCQTLTLLLIHNYPVNYFSQFCGWDICQIPNSEIVLTILTGIRYVIEATCSEDTEF